MHLMQGALSMSATEEASTDLERQHVELSETERAVAHLWCEVMQMSALPGPNEDFFALGGDSMTMVLVEFRVTEELGVQLPTGALLAAPTVRELASLIDGQSPSAAR
jgi:acyl carrier protein